VSAGIGVLLTGWIWITHYRGQKDGASEGVREWRPLLTFTRDNGKRFAFPGEDNGVGELIGTISAAEKCYRTPHFVITVTTVCFPAIVKISIDETNQPLCL
jgi:hypothetical protein